MKVRILDGAALRSVTPGGLAAYAGSAGWAKVEPYGDVADVWQGEGLPEIVLPRTNLLGDYASVVSRVIEIFAERSGKDEIAVLKDLLEADHDVVRVRAMGDATNGSIALDSGVGMVSQARDMVLAAARATVGPPQPVYRGRVNKRATAFMEGVRLGQTEHGSFVVSLMAPVAPTTVSALDASRLWGEQEPFSRRVVLRLVEALQASRRAADRWESGSPRQDLEGAVSSGVSANLCDAVLGLIESTNRFEVRVAWATNGGAHLPAEPIEFSELDRQPLNTIAEILRTSGPRLNTPFIATVHRLTRDQPARDGAAVFKTPIHGRMHSVQAVLDKKNYYVAIRAHETGSHVIVEGDLEKIDKPWRVKNANVREWRPHEEDDS